MDHVPSVDQHDADAGGGRGTLNQGVARLIFAGLALLAAAGFTGLGVWQIERRAWKLELIERVERRVHAAPVPIAAAMGDDPSANAYRRVRMTGSFLHDRETLVQAVTERGAGFWVLTPLRTAQVGTVLVNRGFVPPERRDPTARAAGQVAGETTVTGLLRVSEPGGGFLRANDPATDRWYSRDVAAIAAARGIGRVAPFFVDADAAPNPGGWPAGGLTTIRFRNTHLAYALTWFALAAMSIVGAVVVLRGGRTGR